MGILYSNFDDFAEKNKSIFNLYKKNNRGKNNKKNDDLRIFEAVWKARQSEIDNLQTKIDSMNLESQKQKKLLMLKDENLKQNNNKFTEFFNELEKENLELKTDTENKNLEIDKLKEKEKKLFLIKKNVLSLNATIKELTIRNDKHHQVKQIIEKELFDKNSLLNNTEKQLKKSKAINTSFKKKVSILNQKMKKLRANAQTFEIDAEQSTEASKQVQEQLNKQQQYVEKLKEYIQRFKSNSVVLKEQMDVSKKNVKKFKIEKQNTITKNIELEKKVEEFIKKMKQLSDEKSEIKYHNSQLQKRLLKNKEFIKQNKLNQQKLLNIIELSRKNEKNLKNEIVNFHKKIQQNENEVRKIIKSKNKVLHEKEQIKKELDWLNHTFKGINATLDGVNKKTKFLTMKRKAPQKDA